MIVSSQNNLSAFLPLVEHRKSKGYHVTIRTLESLPFVSCGEIRAAIEAWRLLGPSNADEYCLLVGDAGVLPLCPSATLEQIPASPNPRGFTVLVTDGNGVPQPGVLVSVWKKPFDPALGPDDLLAAVYTGTGGQASFTGPTTLGSIHVMGRDDDGNVAKQISAASNGAFQKLGQGTTGTQSMVPRLDSSSTLQANLPVSIRLQDGRVAAGGAMFASLNDTPVPHFGGIVYTFPEFFSQVFFTDGSGDWTFFVPNWPAGLPSSLELFFQAGVLDDQAVGGVALTNTLRAVTP